MCIQIQWSLVNCTLPLEMHTKVSHIWYLFEAWSIEMQIKNQLQNVCNVICWFLNIQPISMYIHWILISLNIVQNFCLMLHQNSLASTFIKLFKWKIKIPKIETGNYFWLIITLEEMDCIILILILGCIVQVFSHSLTFYNNTMTQ